MSEDDDEGEKAGGGEDLTRIEQKVQKLKCIAAEMVAELQPTEARWLADVVRWITDGRSKGDGSRELVKRAEQRAQQQTPNTGSANPKTGLSGK